MRETLVQVQKETQNNFWQEENEHSPMSSIDSDVESNFDKVSNIEQQEVVVSGATSPKMAETEKKPSFSLASAVSNLKNIASMRKLMQ